VKISWRGHKRLEGVDYEILRFVHEESLGALEHFRMLAEQEETGETVNGNIYELTGYGYLVEQFWKQQEIYYFTLGWKGMRALRSKRKDVAFWHQWIRAYRPPESLNRQIGPRLKSGLVRLILRGLGLKHWTSGRVLRERDRRNYPLPAGEILACGRKIAVFIEEYRRFPIRDYERLFKACKDSGYDEVWMIAEWDIHEFIRETWKSFRTIWPQVWFADYDEFVAKREKTRFINHQKEAFVIGDFGSDVRREEEALEKEKQAEEDADEDY